MTRRLSGVVLVAAGALLLSAACADAVDSLADEVEEVVDCTQLCQAYDECVEPGTDVAECVSRCEDDSDSVPGYVTRADRCESCLDGKSCDEADGAGCWTDCPPLVSAD